MKKTMQKRILFGSVMLAALVALLWLDYHLQQTGASHGGPLALAWLGITVLAFREMSVLAASLGIRTLNTSGLLGTMVLATIPVWGQFVAQCPSTHSATCWPSVMGSPLLILLGLIVVAVFLEQMIRFRVTDALRQIAATLLSVMYLGVGGALILEMRTLDTVGIPGLVMFLAAVKFTDIGAYFTGSFIGKHKMIPWLSPGKTWEGLAGGLTAAAGISLLATWSLKITIFGDMATSPSAIAKTIAFGVIVGAAGQFGDLCESLLKRASGVKDSGALVPEFGGVLDIIDSPLLAAPVAILLLNLL